MSINISDKIKTSLMMNSYFDTLGFKNTEWEFNFNFNNNNNNLQANLIWLHIVHNYFVLGGSNIDISSWNASDDTILTLATGHSILKGGNIKNYIDEYKSVLKSLEDSKRASGVNTINTLKKLLK